MRSSESGSEEEDEELVAPLEAPAASAAAADGGATAEATSSWQFDAWRRDSLSRSRTRHSSLDAGHLEHRAYTALQALEGRASALPQHHSAGSIHSSSRPSARQAQRNEDIEIGWVSLWVRAAAASCPATHIVCTAPDPVAHPRCTRCGRPAWPTTRAPSSLPSTWHPRSGSQVCWGAVLLCCAGPAAGHTGNTSAAQHGPLVR